MKWSLELTQNLLMAYTELCKPLCRELNIPQTAFDILMFLANNPEYQTARDIVEIRRIKANLVSINVEKLVKEGYLRRELLQGDRRKIRLVCTERATPIVEQGRALQAAFSELLLRGIPKEQRESFSRTLETIAANLADINTLQQEKEQK